MPSSLDRVLTGPLVYPTYLLVSVIVQAPQKINSFLVFASFYYEALLVKLTLYSFYIPINSPDPRKFSFTRARF